MSPPIAQTLIAITGVSTNILKLIDKYLQTTEFATLL
jgi:hypothetical protein